MADISRVVLAAGTGSVAAVAPTARLRLMGLSVAEAAGVPAAASLSIQEGAGTDLTKEMAAFSFAASGSSIIWFGDHGLPCPGGLWVNRTSGNTRLAIYYRVSDRDKDSFEPPSW